MPRRDTIALALLAAALSLAALFYFRDSILLYGDSVAHITIARRTFDSLTPSPLQLGTVWLPLPHLLLIPFVLPMSWWHSGIGGSVPSMLAYVFAVVGIARLAHLLTGSRVAAWFAALVFALNPSLLYMQTTAMTEPLCIALFVWATYFFARYAELSRSGREQDLRLASRALARSGLCIAAMMLTRYDGWFAGLVFVLAAAVVLVRRRGLAFLRQLHAPLWRGVRNFVLIAAAAPAFWLAYNWYLSGDPLDFALGPYSARAIAERTATPGVPHPGNRDVSVAATFFRKVAELNLGEAPWHHWLFYPALAATALAFLLRRGRSALLLWLPWPFYALSVAYGSVPIFMPVWWPHSYYNVRYGLQLLPAVAIGLALLLALAVARAPRREPVLAGLFLAFGLLVGATYATAWRATPITLREAQVNSRARVALETHLAEELRQLPPDSLILMYLGDHGGALQRAGIPLRRTINESTHWRAEMPHGLWERALADPAAHADFAVAVAGDPVARALAAHPDAQPLARIDVPGKPLATLYRLR